LQPHDSGCVLVHGGAKEDNDRVLLLRLSSSDGSGGGGGGGGASDVSSSDGKQIIHDMPLPKGPDDKSPDVMRRTVGCNSRVAVAAATTCISRVAVAAAVTIIMVTPS
jgi:hypothetical protein